MWHVAGPTHAATQTAISCLVCCTVLCTAATVKVLSDLDLWNVLPAA